MVKTRPPAAWMGVPCLATLALVSCHRETAPPPPAAPSASPPLLLPAPRHPPRRAPDVAAPLRAEGSLPGPPEQPPAFAGTQACAGCHPKRVAAFLRTAHALTSQKAAGRAVLGTFAEGKNLLQTRNPRLWFEMHARPEGLYQDTVETTPEGTRRAGSERIDLVTGSGKKGQTYLTWKGDRLFELPVSYMASHGWVNSPGYDDGSTHPPRPIPPPCLDCHATYFQVLPGPVNRYARSGYLLGVGCERCHGPGLRHVEYHRRHPGDHQARFIVNPADLSVELQSDLCAQCHSDQGQRLRPFFTYQPGEPLSSYRVETKSEEEQNAPGAHAANQPARLHRSRCYRESPALTCTTCHNPHAAEAGDLAGLSRRCLGCHQRGQCPFSRQLGPAIEDDCIDCHMRLGEDRQNTARGRGGLLLPSQRDHLIGIYPDLSRRFLSR